MKVKIQKEDEIRDQITCIQQQHTPHTGNDDDGRRTKTILFQRRRIMALDT